MSDEKSTVLLKDMITNIINDKHSVASDKFHSYLADKMKQVYSDTQKKH